MHCTLEERESAGPGCVGCNEDSIGFHHSKHRMRLKSEETRLGNTKTVSKFSPTSSCNQVTLVNLACMYS